MAALRRSGCAGKYTSAHCREPGATGFSFLWDSRATGERGKEKDKERKTKKEEEKEEIKEQGSLMRAEERG